jgi:pimeloyl-ACP methyl ester carboxylesterase
VAGLHAWRWGEGGRIVVCLHGWEGRGSQFGPMAERLAARGLAVVAVDWPGHGRNRRVSTHLMQFARAVRQVQEELGPLHGLVGHSMGGAASALAVRAGLRTERLVLVASPTSIRRILAEFAARVGLDEATREAFYAAMRRTVGHGPEEVDLAAGALAVRALAVHDPEDPQVPFADPQRLVGVWPEVEVARIAGSGHHRILRHPDALAAIERFLAG